MTDLYEYWGQAQAAAQYLRERGCIAPIAAIQCGSGLAPLTDSLWPDGLQAAGGGRCAFTDVPHLHSPGVTGHVAELLWGDVPGPGGPRRVLVFGGRLHLYEGHPPLTAAFPATLAAALGCHLFVLTNAAGGLNQHFALGDCMVQRDFINFQGDNPLAHLALTAGSAKVSGLAGLTRFADPKPAYDRSASALLAQQLQANGLGVQHGVYVGVRGPIFETQAELFMLRGFGADAVGMSSIPELTVCHFFRLPVVGVSVITNECFSTAPVSHAEVLAASLAAAAPLGAALRAFFQVWQPEQGAPPAASV